MCCVQTAKVTLAARVHLHIMECAHQQPITVTPLFDDELYQTLKDIQDASTAGGKLVRIRKETARQSGQSCTVYIGPNVHNEHWQLPKSIWSNPFHGQPDSLTRYRELVLGKRELFTSLPSLINETLGCFCDDPSKCHGSVLLQLLKELKDGGGSLTVLKKSDRKKGRFVPFHVGEKIYFFRGEDSVLSNLARTDIRYRGLRFKTLLQLRCYQVAEVLEDTSLMEQALNPRLRARSTMRLSEMVHAASFTKRKSNGLKIWTFQQSVLNMILLIRMKFDQVPMFRSTCLENKDKIFMELTKNTFWAAGTEIQPKSVPTFEHQLRIWDFRGWNMLGWIISLVANEDPRDRVHLSTQPLPTTDDDSILRRCTSFLSPLELILHNEERDWRKLREEGEEESIYPRPLIGLKQLITVVRQSRAFRGALERHEMKNAPEGSFQGKKRKEEEEEAPRKKKNGRKRRKGNELPF